MVFLIQEEESKCGRLFILRNVKAGFGLSIIITQVHLQETSVALQEEKLGELWSRKMGSSLINNNIHSL